MGQGKGVCSQGCLYCQNKNQGHKDLHCKMTGLTLLPYHSYLGASSYGVILNHRYHREKGVLEIKCPYSIEKNPIYNLPLIEIARAFSQQFFLEKIESQNRLKLKRSSNYYYQVQAEMTIMGCKWCHFVVWRSTFSLKKLPLTRGCGVILSSLNCRASI